MALLCFLLDLRNIPPPILDLLKQISTMLSKTCLWMASFPSNMGLCQLEGPRGNMFMSQREKARDADRIYAFSEPQTTASPFRVPKDRLPSQPKERKLPSQQPKEKASPSISEEWEKLIIIDDNDDFCTPVSSSRAQFPRPPRLEAPKAKKQRASKAAGAGAAMASGRSD
ncbi:hypothetical protein TRIUR3_06043 [Triticum urartu]|uniref:Uncharacterized protein n=1 Tax=Triticum urartu TaxID=4572 RepID=M7Y627_TRIUA|nr:hypothetical protein TRIUR3_06043 [Triticum urartu]